MYKRKKQNKTENTLIQTVFHCYTSGAFPAFKCERLRRYVEYYNNVLTLKLCIWQDLQIVTFSEMEGTCISVWGQSLECPQSQAAECESCCDSQTCLIVFSLILSAVKEWGRSTKTLYLDNYSMHSTNFPVNHASVYVTSNSSMCRAVFRNSNYMVKGSRDF